MFTLEIFQAFTENTVKRHFYYSKSFQVTNDIIIFLNDIIYFFRLLIFYVFTQLKQLPPRLQILLELCPWRAPKTNAFCTFYQDVSTHYLFQSKKKCVTSRTLNISMACPRKIVYIQIHCNHIMIRKCHARCFHTDKSQSKITNSKILSLCEIQHGVPN